MNGGDGDVGHLTDPVVGFLLWSLHSQNKSKKSVNQDVFIVPKSEYTYRHPLPDGPWSCWHGRIDVTKGGQMPAFLSLIQALDNLEQEARKQIVATANAHGVSITPQEVSERVPIGCVRYKFKFDDGTVYESLFGWP